MLRGKAAPSPHPRPSFLAACLLAIAGLACAQSPLVERIAATEARLLAERATLAQAAFDLGLLREAGMQARRVLEAQPEHALQAMLGKLKAIDGEDYARTYRDAAAKEGRGFQKRTQKACAPFAVELVALADEAMAAGDAELAERLYGRAYAVDPDQDKALQALRKLDYDAIFNYGVLPKEHKAEARATLRKLGGRFLLRGDLTKELDTWVDAWGLQTRRYRFVTNAPHGTVFAFAQACEDLYAAWQDWMTANKQPLRELSKPCTVFLFGSRIDYESVLRLQGEDPPDSDDALGYYTPATKIGYFYYDDAFYQGDRTLLFETFYHEGAHQMFDLRWKAAWRGRADDKPLEWVEEGTAVYLESLVMEGAGEARKARFGGLVDDDLDTAIELAAAGELMPMAEFAHQTEDSWDAYGGAYPHAALVVHWLIHGDGGKRKALAFDLLLAEKQNGGLRKGTFFELVGLGAEQVDAALREYAAKLGRDVPRRKYAEPKADEPGK